VLNAHWLPDFRDNSGAPFTAGRHGAYWKAKLLYLIAGDFPCSPSFGPGCVVEGIELPPHGWTANEEWTVEGLGVEEGSGAAWARFSLRSPAPAMPLAWTRCDLVLPGQPAYFTVMQIANGGKAAQAINVARHNTLGAPFLQAGHRAAPLRWDRRSRHRARDGGVDGLRHRSRTSAPGARLELRGEPGVAAGVRLLLPRSGSASGGRDRARLQ